MSTPKDFTAETDASSRKLVASWMTTNATSLRSRASNVRFLYGEPETLSIYAERYAKLLDEMAALFEADATILMGKDFEAS